MRLSARFFLALCALSAMAATPAWACDAMAQSVVVAGSHHPHDAFAAEAGLVGAPAHSSLPMGAAAPDCNRCANCVFCACLCEGLVRTLANTWFFPGTHDLPQRLPQALVRLGAAPELKPPSA